MQDSTSGKRILDPVERARLGLQLLDKPLDEALAAIDSYVAGKDYDQQSVDFFKDQIATQCKIRKEGSELLSTGGKIFSLVVDALSKNISQLREQPGSGSQQ